ncbi:hypothetical protein DPEC_G00162950, partial [Dallia pectoralis]
MRVTKHRLSWRGCPWGWRDGDVSDSEAHGCPEGWGEDVCQKMTSSSEKPLRLETNASVKLQNISENIFTSFSEKYIAKICHKHLTYKTEWLCLNKICQCQA